MRLKEGVRIRGIKAELVFVLQKCDEIHKELFKKEMVITSLNDSRHGLNSYHYKGLAADLRLKDKPREKWELFRAVIATTFPECDVLIESPDTPNAHLHLEVDQRKVV